MSKQNRTTSSTPPPKLPPPPPPPPPPAPPSQHLKKYESIDSGPDSRWILSRMVTWYDTCPQRGCLTLNTCIFIAVPGRWVTFSAVGSGAGSSGGSIPQRGCWMLNTCAFHLFHSCRVSVGFSRDLLDVTICHNSPIFDRLRPNAMPGSSFDSCTCSQRNRKREKPRETEEGRS